MSLMSIPIRLALEEIVVAALMEAADALEAEQDATSFLAALNGNHRLWTGVREMGPQGDGTVPSSRDADFAVGCSASLGRGVADANVEALISINRRVAAQLAGDGDSARIRTRVRLAYRESGSGDGFVPWLLHQIGKKNRLGAIVRLPPDRSRLHAAGADRASPPPLPAPAKIGDRRVNR